jgi:hypothetical protein
MAYPATQPRSVFTERDKQTSVLFERLFSARDDSERERASSSRSSPSTSTCARRWPVATTARPPAVVREELEQELGATPSEDDLAAAVGASVDELREVARATTAFRQLSIDCSPVDDDRPSLAAVLSRPDGELERAEDRGPRTEDRGPSLPCGRPDRAGRRRARAAAHALRRRPDSARDRGAAWSQPEARVPVPATRRGACTSISPVRRLQPCRTS